MMNALTDLALATGGSIELSIAVKATLVAALGLAGVSVARRARASRRHLVLAATIGVLLALPLAVVLAPPVGIAVPSVPPAPVALVFSEPPLDSASAFRAMAQRRAVPVDDMAPSRAWPPSPIALLRTAWLAGVALFLLPVIVMTWRVHLLRRTGLPWLSGDARAGGLARAAGIRRQITVLLHESVEAPMTCGLWRPALLLPRDAPAWSQADVERALLHEIEHVRRADWPAHVAARATCALYWFHPLVWMAWRQLHLEAERACDDAVAARTDRSAYAEQLVTLAQRLSAGAAQPVLAMAARGDLSRRVRAVLDDGQTRGRAGMPATAAAAVAVVIALVAISPLTAVSGQQTPEAGPRSFEVASVRRNVSTAMRPFMDASNPNGTFAVTNMTLGSIIRSAYGVGAYQLRPFATVEGEPRWINDRYDIVAKAALPIRLGGSAANPSLGDYHYMLQSLLAERFKLAVHWETRDAPTYELVLARRDGSLGPQLRASTLDCEAFRTANRAALADPASAEAKAMAEQRELLERALRNGDASLLKGKQPPPTCGTRAGGDLGGREILIGTQPLKALVDALARTLTRPVVDRTGLTGNFDVRLTWAPERTASFPTQTTDGSQPQGIPVASDPTGPPLTEALRDQLGLRLEPGRGPVEVLVIDHVEQPTPQ